MKRKFNMSILFALIYCFCCIYFINNSYCADKNITDTEGVKTTKVKKEKEAKKDNNVLDDIQKQYINNLSNINAELESIYPESFRYEKLFALNHEMKILNLKLYGKILPKTESDEIRYRDEDEKFKAKEKKLKNDKNNLKLDALKFYKGKMPTTLKKKWDQEEKRHSEWIDQYNSQRQKE